MARIRMLKAACGPGCNRDVGKIYDVDDDTALAYVEAGAAELLPASARAQPVVEVAIRPEPENAALRTTPPAKRRR